MREHIQLITSFQAHIVVIGRDHSLDKNPRSVLAIATVFHRNKDNK
jgi:hypothetical protein